MTLRHLAAAAWVVAALLLGSPVRAQTASPGAGPASSTAVDPDAELNARRLFEAGRAAFEAGRYEDALAYFERAHALSQRVQLLYNVGVTAERLGYRDRAIAAFEAFLATAGDAPNRAEVETRLEILRRAPEPREPDPEPAQAPAAEPEPAASIVDAPERDRGPLPAILLASGGAVAGAGALFVGLAQRSFARVEDAPEGTPWSARSDDFRRARGMTGAGIAALGLGAAAATVGVVLMVTGPKDDDHANASRGAVRLALTGDGLRLTGRF